MKATFTSCLFYILLLSTSVVSLDQQTDEDSSLVSRISQISSAQSRIASRLANIASRLAGTANGNGTLHRRRRHGPAAAQQHKTETGGTAAALGNIKQGLVQSGSVEFKGHKLTVVALTNDEYVGRYIVAAGQPFQSDLLGPLMDHITPGSVVVDAGANMGDFSIFFAAATGPTGVVYAFEPQARMFQLLCTNMIINGLLQIVPMHGALSYEPGTLQMSGKVTDGSSEGKAYKDTDKKANLNYGGMRLGIGGEKVQAIALDSLNLTNVSVIKVDVQGAEKLVFYGARDTIKRNLPIVAYEPITRSIEENMAKDVANELKLPQRVRDFNIDDYLTDLGYTKTMAGVDKLMLPPGKTVKTGRRMVLAMPPHKR